MTTRQDDFVLSGFADEIDDSLDIQIDVLDEPGIEHIDLRSVDGTNILDLGDEAVAETRRKLDDHGIAVAALGTPIGKIGVTDPFERERERIERALDLAERFDADYLRVFSYYIPEGDDPADHRDEVLRRVETTTAMAEEVGVTLGHENEKPIYGDTPERCRDLLTTIDSPRFRAVFDPANFLEIGVTPYPDALLQVAEFVEHLHVKDATHGEEGASCWRGRRTVSRPGERARCPWVRRLRRARTPPVPRREEKRVLGTRGLRTSHDSVPVGARRGEYEKRIATRSWIPDQSEPRNDAPVSIDSTGFSGSSCS